MPKRADQSRSRGRRRVGDEVAARVRADGSIGRPTATTQERLQRVEAQMLAHRTGRAFEREIAIEFGVSLRSARRYVDTVRKRWIVEAQARGDLVAKKAAAVRRLMRIAEQAEPRDKIAAEKLIADIEGLKAPIQIEHGGFDPSRLTTEQLARIVAGEDPAEVIGDE